MHRFLSSLLLQYCRRWEIGRGKGRREKGREKGKWKENEKGKWRESLHCVLITHYSLVLPVARGT